MKQFSLEEFKKNPTRKVVTRDGRKVRIICTDAVGSYPIIALIRSLDNEDYPWRFRNDGTLLENEENENDLFFEAEKRYGWVNVYRNEEGIFLGKRVYASKEKAEEFKDSSGCLDTINIEWEELL